MTHRQDTNPVQWRSRIWSITLPVIGIALLLLTACAPPEEHQGPVNITVNADREIYPFSDNLRGFATNNWNWLWGNIAELDSPRRAALLETARGIDPGVIRFGGGLWANSVGWDRIGQAPEDGEWTFTEPETGERFTYRHAYKPEMIESYARFARDLNAETIMQINVCDNNPIMWADFLHYTNVENRWGFKYWELGNEIDLAECISLEEYERRFVTYSAALKEVDPDIIVLGPSTSEPFRTEWYDALPSASGGQPEALSFHWYHLTRWNEDPTHFSYQAGSLEALFAHTRVVGESCQGGFGCPGDDVPLSRLDRIYARRGFAEAMKQEVFDPLRRTNPDVITALTETGVHASRHEVPINGNHIAALWLADMLGRWAYNGLDILTYYSFEDGTDGVGQTRGLIGLDGAEVLDVRPTYITEWLYANHFGDMMVESETNYFDQELVAWASKNSSDPNALQLMIVNLSGKRETVNFEVSGFELNANTQAGAYVMSSDAPLSRANPESFAEHTTKINGVVIPDVPISQPEEFTRIMESIEPVPVQITTSEFAYVVDPYTVVALTIWTPSDSIPSLDD